MEISRFNAICIVIALLFLVCTKLKAQDGTNPTEIKSLTKIRLTLFGVGLEREQKISQFESLYVGANISTVYLFNPKYVRGGRAPDVLNIEETIGYTPAFYAGFRRYYNLSERKDNNKKIINNSANYLGFHMGVIPHILSINKDYKTYFAVSLAPHWGIQRNLGKIANFEFALGPAIKTDFKVVKIVPFSKIGFSVLL